MAARGWLMALLAQLLVAVWLGREWLSGLAGTKTASDWMVAILVGAATLACLQLAFSALGAVLAGAATAKNASPADRVGGAALGPARGGVIRACLSEALHFTLIQWFMALEPWYTRRWDEPARGARPVLLVHGVLCNRAVWWRLRRRLLARGYGPVLAVNLPNPGGAIDSHVGILEEAVARLVTATSGVPAVIIAHSMGGLVVRAWLEKCQGAGAARVVTIGTPHAGSRLARLRPTRGCHDLRPGSAWLRAHESSYWSSPVPSMSIYSLADNLVAPRGSARWPAATENVVVAGVGHFGLVSAPRAMETVLRAPEIPS